MKVQTSTAKPVSQTEFIAIVAMLFATIAISIDAMLPALPQIAATLSPGAPNAAQLVVTSFVFGMGLGTLFTGPLSDAFGRKRAIMVGSALYAAAAVACYFAATPEALLIARMVQGIGSAAPRIVSIAMVRDLFKGREMARILSFAMMIFTLSSMQAIFETRFDHADSFPLWFALIALAAMSGSLLNSRIVMTLGMRRVVIATYTLQTTLTLIFLATIALGLMPEALAFPAHILWSIGLFSMMGLTMGNLNALAMEPVGHIAGLAASVISSLATVGSVLLAIPIGLAFNGTVLPLLTGVAVLLGLALILMRTALAEGR